MARRLKQQVQNSKLYSVNWLSLTHNNDQSHEKMWSQKVQQAKHIQQQKQIDRILCGIVKERLFGQLLSHQTRISDEGFYALDKLNKQLVNRIQGKNSRKISPLPNQRCYDIATKNKLKNKTIDVFQSRASNRINKIINQQNVQLRSIKKLRPKKSFQNSLNKTKKLFFIPVNVSVQKLNNLHNHFRQISNNQTPIIYDIKLTKDMLIKYNKQKNLVSQRCLQRFLFFFNFPSSVNLKQYGNWVENALNCSMNQSSFFCFQMLDQSHNGFLTISDLFRALQDFPIVHSSLLQKQIYMLMEKIKEVTQILQSSTNQFIKPTIQQLIIRNQTLKIQEMRQLVKQSGKQLVSVSCFKSTAYHKSMYALEHNSSTREKNLQLQYSQHKEQLKNQKKTITMKQDGIRFRDYSQIFSSKRSQLFLLVAKILIGVDSVILQ